MDSENGSVGPTSIASLLSNGEHGALFDADFAVGDEYGGYDGDDDDDGAASYASILSARDVQDHQEGDEESDDEGASHGAAEGAVEDGDACSFGVRDVESDDDFADIASIGGASAASLAREDECGAGASHEASREQHANRTQAASAVLIGSALAVALVIWGLMCGVSANSMERLFRILHVLLPEACRTANLPKRHDTAVRMMGKAEKVYRGDDKGFVTVNIPVTEAALLRRRIFSMTIFRRSIRETVSRICQNPANQSGSLRTQATVPAVAGTFGDVMDSPMLRRIQNLADHTWVASGVPEDERLTLYAVVSKDGTIASAHMPAEASTLTLANLERDERNSNGNVKLLSVYRTPTLHNPTAASVKKAKYKPTKAEKEAMRWVGPVCVLPLLYFRSHDPLSPPSCSRMNQVIEQQNVDEFIDLAKNIFVLSGIFGLATGRKIMSCLVLPALWLGDLLGQNKLACLLSWACRRCMVRYHELGNLIIQSDGTADPSAPRARQSYFHRSAYEFQARHRSDRFLTLIDASPHVRPALLNLGSDDFGVGAACLECGFLAGVPSDYMHTGRLGIQKMVVQCLIRFIIDAWHSPAAGALAVRRLELRIAHQESFRDGVVERKSFASGFLRDSGSGAGGPGLMTAGEYIDLLHLLVAGIGTDGLVIPNADTRHSIQEMIEDLIYVDHVVTGLSVDTATLESMQKSNFR